MDNKHYIHIDQTSNITKGFSDAFEQPQLGDICIAEEAGRHFELLGEVNPPLMDANGVYLYRYTGGEVTAKTPEEIEEEAASKVIETPAVPTLEERVKAQSIIAAKAMGAEVELTPEILTIATAGAPIIELEQGEPWRSGVRVTVGVEVTHEGTTYTCIQEHVTQPDWPPDVTPALWKKQQTQGEPWRQPQGAHDSYPKGALVTHKGKTWVSDIDGNVWEPGIYGWSEINR